MEQTPRAQSFFKDLRAAVTSAAVTRDVRLPELLLVSMMSALGLEGGQFNSYWKWLAQ